jgi:TatD DNase family protein
MRLIDSHCHLQADRFAGDLEDVIEAARAAGVERILVPGWDRASSEAALELTARHPWLDVAVGIHPHEAASAGDDDWAWVVDAAADPRVVAIGETGLDYDRAFSPVEAQLRNLRRHLALAGAAGKPAILHCRSALGRRDAKDALLVELREAGFDAPEVQAAFGARPPAVLHSFSGPVDYAEAALEMGLAVSFSGLAFRSGEEASGAVAALVPPGSLLVETDSPFLSPPGAPRRRNEPAWVAITAGWVAERRAEDADVLGAELVRTYDRTFGRAPAEDDRGADGTSTASVPGDRPEGTPGR